MTKQETKKGGIEKAAWPDVDIAAYAEDADSHTPVEAPSQLPAAAIDEMAAAGIDASERERTGSYIQIDHSVVHCKSQSEGIEVLKSTEALEKHDWAKDYFWKLVSDTADKFTAQAERQPHHGYFIRVLPEVKASFPLQSCLFISKPQLIQNVHNVIILEPGAELHIITGCATAAHVKSALHIGISEIYVQKGASLTFTMIHNWERDVMVRPRTAARVEEGGTFISNYISLKPVKSLQMYPKTFLQGRGAVARYSSILYASPGTHLDVGAAVTLQAPETKAEIISRAISGGGTIIARGRLIGEIPGVKAHLECRGLILSEQGSIHAIPELVGRVKGIDMSHEAAIGKIAEEEIEYLMSRGMSASEAQTAIVRGFLDVNILGLPPKLQAEIDRAIAACEGEVVM